MRMETSAEAAPLPVTNESEHSMRANANHAEDDGVCHDCCNNLLSCRCSPGEG